MIPPQILTFLAYIPIFIIVAALYIGLFWAVPYWVWVEENFSRDILPIYKILIGGVLSHLILCIVIFIIWALIWVSGGKDEYEKKYNDSFKNSHQIEQVQPLEK